MSFGDILYQIIIGPLKLLFEVIYVFANNYISNYGLSIIVLSLVMNVLLLPLYDRADKMQAEEAEIEKKLKPGVDKIKKAFKGDERFMVLQTYYRQNNYKPTDVVRGSVSLLLEIPFFMAAYAFLSGLADLDGVRFGPISNLGAPDGLVTIFNFNINLLPILMTTINLISCFIFTKGQTIKSKIQLYVMALFFLVFLYDCPSGLVFYWTLNNLFSLIKTIFYKLKNPKKVLSYLLSIVGILLIILAIRYSYFGVKVVILFVLAGIVLQLPLIKMLFIKDKLKRNQSQEIRPNKTILILGELLLTIFIGVLIPSTYIAANPLEYIDATYYVSPMWFVISSLCLSIGVFIVWFNVLYWLLKKNVKVVLEKLVWIFAIVAVVDYMFFGTNLGTISSSLSYIGIFSFSFSEQIINLLVAITLSILVYFVISRFEKRISILLFAIPIVCVIVSGLNIINIQKQLNTTSIQDNNEIKFSLSKDGKNVVVIMLDRALGEYIPYIFNEKPELKKQYDGFTYYSNVISYGASTNFTTPSLYGGYEYTPLEINNRSEEKLVEKQNEALKVMPVLFDENDYDVTVINPTYANYSWIPDLSIYDEYEDINAFNTGSYFDQEGRERIIQNNMRNFFCFSVMKSMPLFFQEAIYNGGSYLNSAASSNQVILNKYSSKRISSSFQASFKVLENLSNITKITSGKNTFLMMSNDTTHEVQLLQEPDYYPSEEVDNTEYEENNQKRFIVDGVQLTMESSEHYAHYQSNMAAIIQIGEWLDYLKENDIYDNTRIIIVSDHGYAVEQLQDLMLNDESDFNNTESYFPLLLVKDFDAKDYDISDEFMTNADVPIIAMSGLIQNPTNPFTGNPIDDLLKNGEQYILGSEDFMISNNDGTQFNPGIWLSVKDDARDLSNWAILQECSISPFEEIK